MDSSGCPRIANFGLYPLRRTYTPILDREIFQSQRGTVHFQAPELLLAEQSHEAEPTTMSDMYALAMTIIQASLHT